MPNDPNSRCPAPRASLAAGILSAALLAACATPSGSPLDGVMTQEPESSEASVAVQQGAAERLQQAMELVQPRKSNLGRARGLLQGVLADRSVDALPYHSYARTLLDQVNERIRLNANIERLTQQLEQNGRQLRDSQQQREQLQRKLDALAEIEGNLSPRGAALPLPAAKPQ